MVRLDVEDELALQVVERVLAAPAVVLEVARAAGLGLALRPAVVAPVALAHGVDGPEADRGGGGSADERTPAHVELRPHPLGLAAREVHDRELLAAGIRWEVLVVRARKHVDGHVLGHLLPGVPVGLAGQRRAIALPVDVAHRTLTSNAPLIPGWTRQK